MTAPAPAPVTVAAGSIVTEIEAVLGSIQHVLSFVDKFSAFLPAQYRGPLLELNTILTTVNSFLSKL